MRDWAGRLLSLWSKLRNVFVKETVVRKAKITANPKRGSQAKRRRRRKAAKISRRKNR